MTVRLLAARPPYPINAIVTLDAGTEADLIEQGEASATLTGGTVYNAPAAPTYAAPLMAVTPVGQAPAMLQAASIPKIEAVVSGDGNITEAELLTVTPAEVGGIYVLKDGPNKGVKLTWAVPALASVATWCWWLWPQAAYEG